LTVCRVISRLKGGASRAHRWVPMGRRSSKK